VEPGFDGVHFTPAGHAAFARGLLALLASAEAQD
jgi:lysophospholipase L1-like esterase